MKQRMLSKSDSPLLESAIAKLGPGVFSHPVWIRFGNKNESFSKETINDLFIEADKLLQNKPSEACQVLLMCAVFQHYGGQSAKALATVQKAQDLAEKARLEQEMIWSLWGASAICFQQGNLEQSAKHLAKLKDHLNNQDDWILADFIDVVRQTLIQMGTAGSARQIQFQENPLEGLLTSTFQWLNAWGLSTPIHNQSPGPPNSKTPPKTKNQSLFSFQGWRGHWRSLRLRFAGELIVHWLVSRSGSEGRRFSLWGFMLNLLHINVTASGNEPEIIDKYPESSSIAVPTQVEVSVDNVIVAPKESPPDIAISVHMLGKFSVTIQESALALPSSRSLCLLKYMMFNYKQNTPRDLLMDVFWPDVSPNRARNNLNVAINGIRQAFRAVINVPVIIYKSSTYGMSHELQFWVDVEEFEQLVDSGRHLESQGKLKASIDDCEAAISLYQGDFLEENPYEGWTVLPRERLRLAYLVTLDHLSQIYYHQGKYATCIALSQLILSRDRCREDAHSMLMRCYNHQGQDHMALRQYQACVEALRLELDVTPAPETTKLYEQIRQHHGV